MRNIYKYNKLKVLFVSPTGSLLGGGSPKSLYLILENIDRNKFDPLVVSSNRGFWSEITKKLSIKTFTVESKSWITRNADPIRFLLRIPITLFSTLRIVKIIKNEQIDVVYSNSITTIEGALAAKITKKKHIWHIRELLPKNPDIKFFLGYKFALKTVDKLSNVVVCNSNSVKLSLDSFIKHNKLHVIYNSYDPSFLTKYSAKKICNCSKTHLGIVGFLTPIKGLHYLLSALDLVPKKKYHLLVAGNIYPTNYRVQINKQISNFKLKNNVTLLGFQKNIRKFYESIDILVFPAWFESFGLVILEAMLSGIPVIASNTFGPAEIIENDKTGFLVQVDNKMSFADSIKYCIENPKMMTNISDNAYKHTLENYSPSLMAKKVVSVIENSATK